MSSDMGVVINIFVFKSRNQGAEGRNGQRIGTWDARLLYARLDPSSSKGCSSGVRKIDKGKEKGPCGR